MSNHLQGFVYPFNRGMGGFKKMSENCNLPMRLVRGDTKEIDNALRSGARSFLIRGTR